MEETTQEIESPEMLFWEGTAEEEASGAPDEVGIYAVRYRSSTWHLGDWRRSGLNVAELLRRCKY